MDEKQEYDIKKDSRLDVPGAGIPVHQRFFIKTCIAPFLPYVLNWDRGLKFFQTQVEEIMELVEGLDEQTLSTQVLIPPMMSLEDSSRFYSINMVLEHLVISNAGTMEIVSLLSEEKEIEREISTAKVKPYKNTNHIKNLRVFEKAYTKMIEKNTKRTSKTRKKHPWFGQFNNTHWHAFIGLHNRLHKNQIKQILALMPEA